MLSLSVYKFDPDIILIGCGLLALSGLEYLKGAYSYVNFLSSDIFLQPKHAKHLKLHLQLKLQTHYVLYQVEDPL